MKQIGVAMSIPKNPIDESERLPRRFRFKTVEDAPWRYGFLEEFNGQFLVVSRSFSPRGIRLSELIEPIDQLYAFQWIDDNERPDVLRRLEELERKIEEIGYRHEQEDWQSMGDDL